MGLSLNGVKFLLWAKNLGASFERTATLGHLGLSSPRGAFRRAVRDFGMNCTAEDVDRVYQRPPFTGLFADEFLRFLGAKEVVSIDRSDFEGASLLHDLNKPFPEHLRGTFDLIVDGGTLEHIFYYQNALSHCLDLLRVGGHFVTLAPGTGQMGHGFYQFSPERGFALRKIILYECSKTDSAFYEVEDPAKAMERTISPARPMQLAVFARKLTETPQNLEPPQQSDYVAIWEEHKKKKVADEGLKASAPGFVRRLRVALNPYWPSWLRDFRDACLNRWRWNRGLAAQRTLRNYRRVSNQEMFSERSS